jgi:hypothetical protein
MSKHNQGDLSRSLRFSRAAARLEAELEAIIGAIRLFTVVEKI